MKRFILLLSICFPLLALAQNWEHVKNSGEYYFGEGVATIGNDAAQAEEKAKNNALANLISSIATQVRSDFNMIENESNVNGNLSHEERVENCIKTYSQASLKNVGMMPPHINGNLITMRCYIKKKDLAQIFEIRADKARDFVAMADMALEKRKIDMALQYYYWAYSLLRSLQFPTEVKGSNGIALVETIPLKIESILSKVDIKFEKRDGDYVDLLFKYDGEDIQSIDFTYNDGRAECKGTAKNGRGMIEMIPNYNTDFYHITIDYQYKEQAQGDGEMESVLDVLTPKTFKNVTQRVKGKGNSSMAAKSNTPVQKPQVAATQPVKPQQAEPAKKEPTQSQLVSNPAFYNDIINQVLQAIREKRYTSVTSLFTLDGLDRYNRLISYGKGRIVGTPNIHFYKGMDNTVVARGLQMSFSFKTGIKKTFVEDVIFTFNTENKIDNVTFGLGQVAEGDILYKNGSGWSDQRKEILMEFMENYKTAYCLKDIEYINNIFAHDARIIIGKVLKKAVNPSITQEKNISIDGQKLISYNRITKDQYINNLRRCFAGNEFINLRFSNNTIQYLEKIKESKGKDYFAIQIGQEYNSSRYADKGYLFLLVDLSNHKEPIIHVRTWQPNEVDIDKVYNIGDIRFD